MNEEFKWWLQTLQRKVSHPTLPPSPPGLGPRGWAESPPGDGEQLGGAPWGGARVGALRHFAGEGPPL